GREARAVTRFRDIDIAEPGNDALIQERGLDGGVLVFEQFGEARPVEFVAERFRPQMTQQLVFIELRRRYAIHHAETARVVERDDAAIVKREHDMIVLALFPAVARRVNGHAARHAEMRQQHEIVVGMNQYVFSAAGDALDAPPFERRFKIARQPGAQIGAVEFDLAEPPPDQMLLQSADDGLDFRQFGHQPFLVILSTSAISSAVSAQSAALALASICSGSVAPAITLDTWGRAKSQENASSRRVWPRLSLNCASLSTMS